MLALKIFPTGYIFPKKDRAVHDSLKNKDAVGKIPDYKYFIIIN
jgi:hypothetical protein